MDQEKKSQLTSKLKKIAVKGKIPCGAALKLAADNHISPSDVGELADEIKIKISNCQLGCFK